MLLHFVWSLASSSATTHSYHSKVVIGEFNSIFVGVYQAVVTGSWVTKVQSCRFHAKCPTKHAYVNIAVIADSEILALSSKIVKYHQLDLSFLWTFLNEQCSVLE